MNASFVPLWVAIFICVILPAIGRRKYGTLQIVRKKRGEKRMLPKELLGEFIGKVCEITLFNAGFGVTGKIEAVEDNWMKVTEKGTLRLINGDMIMNIRILPDKYQK